MADTIQPDNFELGLSAIIDSITSHPPTLETTLGALRELAYAARETDRVAIPPMLSEFILDNSFQHDDTKVILAPGDVWIEGER